MSPSQLFLRDIVENHFHSGNSGTTINNNILTRTKKLRVKRFCVPTRQGKFEEKKLEKYDKMFRQQRKEFQRYVVSTFSFFLLSK